MVKIELKFSPVSLQATYVYAELIHTWVNVVSMSFQDLLPVMLLTVFG